MISGIKKSIGICGIFLLASGVTLATAGSAGASTPRPQLKFVGVPTTTATTALLKTPAACPATHPNCVWALAVNEPEITGKPGTGWVTGGSGVTLTVDLPLFCGVVQADALIGVPTADGSITWSPRRGIRTTINLCGTTQTTTSVPPAVNNTAQTTGLPFTSGHTDPIATAAGTTAAGGSTLPFTGMDLQSLVTTGTILLVTGGLLMTTMPTRRRLARRTGSWFFGL
jgi:hypothetical protein